MKYVPISTPVIVPGGLNDCEKFSRSSDVAGSPNCATNGFAAVSRIDAPPPPVNSANKNGAYCPLTAAGQNRIIPTPNITSPVTMPALYPHRRISSAAGIAMQKYPKKFAVCTNCALNCDNSNDFLNCCTRISVKLFDIPHRKNNTVTNTNGRTCPTGNTGCFSPVLDFAPAPTDVEICTQNLTLPKLQTIDIHSRRPKHSITLPLTKSGEVIPQHLEPPPVLTRHQAHRPVRPSHQPLDPERLHRHIQTRPQCLGIPPRPLRLGHHPRHLSPPILSLPQLTHPPRPRLHSSCSDHRLRHVVQHKHLLRMLVHKLDRLRQMPLVDQNVIHQPTPQHRANPGIEILPQDIVFVLLSLDYMPQPLQLGPVLKLLHHLWKILPRNRSPPHHAANRIALIRLPQQPARLLHRLPRLHRNRPADTRRSDLPHQILRQKIPPQLLHRLIQPRILLRRIPPQVMMRINPLCHSLSYPSFVLRLLKPAFQPQKRSAQSIPPIHNPGSTNIVLITPRSPQPQAYYGASKSPDNHGPLTIHPQIGEPHGNEKEIHSPPLRFTSPRSAGQRKSLHRPDRQRKARTLRHQNHGLRRRQAQEPSQSRQSHRPRASHPRPVPQKSRS